MTQKNRGIERIFGGLMPPSPPPELRHDVLRAVARRLAHPAVVDRWEQAYSSRPLRVTWAIAVMVLAATNALLWFSDWRTPQSWFPQEVARRNPELHQVVEAPRLREVYLALSAFAYHAPTSPVPDAGGRQQKERPQ